MAHEKLRHPQRRLQPNSSLEPDDRGDQRVLRGLAADRADSVWTTAEACEACAAARRDSAESEALCDEHMAKALGLTGGWALGGPGRRIASKG